MIPITVEALGELAVDPDITMMTEAIVVDIGGIVLPISSIPNIMVSIEGGLGVKDFILEVAPASFMLYVACLLISMRYLARAVKPGVHPARRRPEGKVASSSPLSLESLKYVAAFLIGIVLPIILEIFLAWKGRTAKYIRLYAPLMIVASILVLVGAFYMRYCFLVAGQAPLFAGRP